MTTSFRLKIKSRKVKVSTIGITHKKIGSFSADFGMERIRHGSVGIGRRRVDFFDAFQESPYNNYF